MAMLSEGAAQLDLHIRGTMWGKPCQEATEATQV